MWFLRDMGGYLMQNKNTWEESLKSERKKPRRGRK
jgi:hypothetical protein